MNFEVVKRNMYEVVKVEKGLNLNEAIECYNELIENMDSDLCEKVEIFVVQNDIYSILIVNDSYTRKINVYDNFKNTILYDNTEIAKVVRTLKNEIEELNDRLTLVERIQNDIEKYHTYALFDAEWSKFNLTVVYENKKVVITLNDVNGYATYMMKKNNFMELTQQKFEIILGNILYYNWVNC